MKHLYINSRLHPLALAITGREVRSWIFSMGEPWLLLTPPRLTRLAIRLGLEDTRIARLVGLVKRHSPYPERFCRPLGVPAEPQLPASDYPAIPCLQCDDLHTPHPEDADKPCPSCRAREILAERMRPGPRQSFDAMQNKAARARLRKTDPQLFASGELSPNWKFNHTRHLQRDWESAVTRILMGCTYRTVASDLNCSTGLLHKKVRERLFWENN